MSLAALLLAATLALPEAKTGAEAMKQFKPESRLRVINVWATWCQPCVAEISDIQAVADEFAKDGVEVVGISLDDAIPGTRAESKQKVQRFLDFRRVKYRNVYFIGRMNDLADELHFDGSIPITIVYDAKGKELARSEGKIKIETFRQMLRKLAKERPR